MIRLKIKVLPDNAKHSSLMSSSNGKTIYLRRAACLKYVCTYFSPCSLFSQFLPKAYWSNRYWFIIRVRQFIQCLRAAVKQHSSNLENIVNAITAIGFFAIPQSLHSKYHVTKFLINVLCSSQWRILQPSLLYFVVNNL